MNKFIANGDLEGGTGDTLKYPGLSNLGVKVSRFG